MSDNWYFVSFSFKTDEEPPTNTAEFIDWLRQEKSITYYDNIQLYLDAIDEPGSRVVELGDTDG